MHFWRNFGRGDGDEGSWRDMHYLGLPVPVPSKTSHGFPGTGRGFQRVFGNRLGIEYGWWHI